ncbi:MAG: HEPN domain-containing protein [Candidatus Woesearchaeota archaeon]
MSQVSKQVDWCLRKAQKDIAECRKQGKKPKHRGLLKTKPSAEEAKKHIEKAEHDLSVTEYLVRGGFTDASIGTIFYTMYQCFLAITAKFGYESGNQTCTISLIEYLIEKRKIGLDDRFLKYFKYEDDEVKESVIEMREDYTYGTDTKADKSKIDFFIKECRELIDATREIVYR